MFMMLTLSVGLSSHVIVLPAVLDVSMRDAWMCGLLAFVVIVPWIAKMHMEQLDGLFAFKSKKRPTFFAIGEVRGLQWATNTSIGKS